jgi:hypothetical protein
MTLLIGNTRAKKGFEVAKQYEPTRIARLYERYTNK